MQGYNQRLIEEMKNRQAQERARLPKIQRSEAKTRMAMFKKSLRITGTGTPEQDREKIKQVRPSIRKLSKTFVEIRGIRLVLSLVLKLFFFFFCFIFEQFAAQEDKRQKNERLHQHQKHENQMRDLQLQCDSNIRELQQMQVCNTHTFLPSSSFLFLHF